MAQEMEKTDDDDTNELAVEEKLKESDLFQRMLNLLWAQTVVDVANTLHETVQMVLMDQSQSAEVRKKRGEGLAVMGEIFENVRGTAEEEEQAKQKFLEEIAFYTVLDTVRRQEEAAQRARKSSDEANPWSGVQTELTNELFKSRIASTIETNTKWVFPVAVLLLR